MLIYLVSLKFPDIEIFGLALEIVGSKARKKALEEQKQTQKNVAS